MSGLVVGVAATLGVGGGRVRVQIHCDVAVGRALGGDGRGCRVVALDNAEWLEIHCAERLVEGGKVRVIGVGGLALVIC